MEKCAKHSFGSANDRISVSRTLLTCLEEKMIFKLEILQFSYCSDAQWVPVCHFIFLRKSLKMSFTHSCKNSLMLNESKFFASTALCARHHSVQTLVWQVFLFSSSSHVVEA